VRNEKNNLETLIKKNDFNFVYKKGKTAKLKKGLVKAVYILIIENDRRRTMMAVTVSSKFGNSVWRNRFKRLIREAVRYEKKHLSEILERKESSLLIVFSPHGANQKNNKKLFLKEIRSDIKSLLMIIFEQTEELIR
jgi:ribonuclease P protein component